MPRALILCFAAATLFAAPPVTRKLDVVDTYFGEKIPASCRWLEDDNSLDTKAWVKAQNEVTSGYLAAISERSDMWAFLVKNLGITLPAGFGK